MPWPKGKPKSEELKNKLSESLKKAWRNHPEAWGSAYRRSPTEISKQKRSDAMKKRWREEPEIWANWGPGNTGKIHSKETKRKIGIASKERLKNPENNPMYGKHHSAETKQKISTKAKERFKDPSNNPNWRGGISFEEYPQEFNDPLKNQIKKRDDYKCKFPNCHTPDDLTIHHIDYNKKNNDPLNLITLCRRHNLKVNFNRDYWADFFQKLNYERNQPALRAK